MRTSVLILNEANTAAGSSSYPYFSAQYLKHNPCPLDWRRMLYAGTPYDVFLYKG